MIIHRLYEYTMISNQLFVQRIGNGVQLAPQTLINNPNSRLDAIMRLPMNFYFMDRDSVMVRMNEHTALTSGYVSATDAVGKSIRDVSDRATISSILENDRKVVNKNISIVSSESYTRFDGSELSAISFKFPWVLNNVIAGIFGCSILLGADLSTSLPESLALLIQTGMLKPDNLAAIPGVTIGSQYFDHRDHDILRLLVRGNTAKQIAKRLGLSFRTIEHRLSVIKDKLQVQSKSELIELIIDEILF
jgi:DNA-binding CsgD family transcriptional regulator